MTPREAYERVQVGFSSYQSGRFDLAEVIANDVLRAAPNDPNGLYLKGMTRLAQSDPAGALEAFLPAHERTPNWVDVTIGIGLAHFFSERLEAAQKWLEDAEAAAPTAFQPKLFLARVHQGKRDRASALAYFKQALDLQPDNVEALSQMARFQELIGDHDEAETRAKSALAIDPKNPLALAVLSRVDIHRGDDEAAARRIEEELDINRGLHVDIHFAMSTLGEARENLGDYPSAFEAYVLGSNYSRRYHATWYEQMNNACSPGTLSGARRLRETYERLGPRELDPRPDDQRAPVFLVGFPRSGTTLLERILAAHPRIQASDERVGPTSILERVGTDPSAIHAFLAAAPEEISNLRREYWLSAGNLGATDPDALYIEKLPLNVVWLGIIAKLFPEAKIIFAVRDPRDAVFSAFKHWFAMNVAMYHMLDLADAAAYYDAVIGAGVAARKAFPALQVIDIKYEDVIADVETEARRVLEFLDLPWSPDVLKYRDQLKDQVISTPSARQVVKPIYTSSIGLWRNYDFALEPVRPVLDPWAEYWGYPVD